MIASTLTRFTIRIHRLLDIVGLSDDQITLVQGSNGGGARDVGSCAHFASPKLAGYNCDSICRQRHLQLVNQSRLIDFLLVKQSSDS